MEGMESITLYSHLCFLEKKEQKHEGVAKEAKAEEEGQTQKQSGMTIAASANKLGATEGGGEERENSTVPNSTSRL